MKTSNTPDSLTLFELNNQVKSGIKEIFPGTYWIIGEVCELSINQSGHCYLELIEKKEDSEQIIARAKATIWAFTFRMLRPYFESVTGQRFSAGIKVLVQVSIEFHEVYGYSLNIKDIEPNFTIGDLSRKRQEIIQRLQDEGVFHLNKELEFSTVPQRVAVISSETAAGYGDFINQLEENPYGYKFAIKLFKAYMQGEEAEQSIIDALERIFNEMDKFDVVVIIRGGGSQADLNCFNSYWLCYHITQFPLPILTGIGHERDESIADLVSHKSLKTPTAVAEFIITTVSNFDAYLNELNERIVEIVTDQLQAWQQETEHLSQKLATMANFIVTKESQNIQNLSILSEKLFKNYLQRSNQQLINIRDRITYRAQHIFQKNTAELSAMQKNISSLLKTKLKEEKARLERLESANHLLDPVRVLKRGYTLTYADGMLIKSPSQLKPGDTIVSKWYDGNAVSSVDEIHTSKPTE